MPIREAMRELDRRCRGVAPPVGQVAAVDAVLAGMAEVVWEACRTGDPAAEAVRWIAGGRRPEGDRRGWTLAQVRELIARDRRYADWAAVAAGGDGPVDGRFEAAADAIVDGDAERLRALVAADPGLVRARSPYRHHATLLHYVAANGVEATRQWQSPGNAVEIAGILLDAGADPDAVCDTYGGGREQTTMALLVSSAHPAEAGVQAGLVERLCRGGAAPDGLDGDGLPLWTAIIFGYPEAVEALARCGARVDNLVFAAALGDVAAVQRYLPPAGPAAGRPATVLRLGRTTLAAEHLLEYALIYAAGHGRREVVELLLQHDPDRTVTDPVFGSTALGMARYHDRTDIAALLGAG